MTHTATVKNSPPVAAAVAAGREFRPDIEGLRAVAVLAVLVYHLKSSLLPGGFIGVDVFFVISGFLITSHLVKEHERTGRISLPRFYARRAIRLIPAATVVLLSTAIATFLFAPRILWAQFGTDIIAAATYVVNWAFASQSINYLAQGTTTSPVLHFWSLAVEEQFYLVWPLLIILAGFVAAKLSARPRLVIGIAGALVVVLSLGAALLGAARQDPSAYFTTTTRLWELAIGAVAAIAFPYVRERMSRALGTALCYVGAAAVILSLLLIRSEDLWPSALTIVPVVGSGLILLSGGGRFARSLPERALGTRPMVWVGGLSYSLYLWHWPIISIATLVWPDLGLVRSVAIGVASILLAWITQKLIENPIRFSKWARKNARRGLIIGLAGAVVSAGAGLVLIGASPKDILAAPSGSTPAGATVLAADIGHTSAAALAKTPKWVLPEPLNAPADVPVLYPDGCQQNQTDSDPLSCTYGDKTASKTIVLVGDSKAGQWLPALNEIAQEHSLRIVLFTKSACAFADAPIGIEGRAYSSCASWNKAVTSAIVKLDPAIVITSQVQPFAWEQHGPQETKSAMQTMEKGLGRSLDTVQKAGAKVVVLADTPQTGGNVYECVAEHPENVDKCSYDRQTGIKQSSAPMQRATVASLDGTMIDASGRMQAGSNPEVVFADMTDAICPNESSKCPPIIGNALIYRQGSHLTATYVKTLTHRLDTVLETVGAL